MGDKLTLEQPFVTLAGTICYGQFKTFAEAEAKAKEHSPALVKNGGTGRVVIYKAVAVVEPSAPPTVTREVTVESRTKPTP